MAIKQEIVTIGDKRFIRTYSDAGFLIYGGEPAGEYEEAIDPIDTGRTYTETDHKPEQPQEENGGDSDTETDVDNA